MRPRACARPAIPRLVPRDAVTSTAAFRHRPPERALRWACDAIGPGSRITRLRLLPQGGWHANHALTVVDRHGREHRLVLRLWARREWAVEDPDLTAAREATVLKLLATSPVPAPRLVAADADGTVCDVPALLIDRLSGHPPGLPADTGAFLTQLAQALPAIHAVDGHGAPIADYHTYYDLGATTPPTWSQRPAPWERALELARAEPPPGRRCFIHRDYHPENTLWTRGRLTAIVDWTQASWGPAAVDVGHMRWNLAVTYGLDAADEFLRLHQSLAGALDDQPYWDLVTALDVMVGLHPGDWPRFDLQRLERHVQATLARAA